MRRAVDIRAWGLEAGLYHAAHGLQEFEPRVYLDPKISYLLADFFKEIIIGNPEKEGFEFMECQSPPGVLEKSMTAGG